MVIYPGDGASTTYNNGEGRLTAPRPRTMTQIQLDDAEAAFDALKGQINRIRGAMEAGDGATVTTALAESAMTLRVLAHLARDIGAKAP